MAKNVGDKIRCPDCGAEAEVKENVKKGLHWSCSVCRAWGGFTRNGKPTDNPPTPGPSEKEPVAGNDDGKPATGDVAWYDRNIF